MGNASWDDLELSECGNENENQSVKRETGKRNEKWENLRETYEMLMLLEMTLRGLIYTHLN
jgi:hypothetical protein